MPEQAILDLPVIEFEQFEDSMARLHAQCIESYGLAGFRPHPDAVFHFAASLWRYREDESLKQVAALSCFYLHALNHHVAARRRVAAVRAAIEEHGGMAMRTRLAEADEDLAYAQEDLTDTSRLLGELVSTFTDEKRRAPKQAAARLERNLQAMGGGGWTDRLERYAVSLAAMDRARIDWTAPLHEVLEDLEELALPEISNGNGNGHHPEVDGGLLDRLKAELDDYRNLATRASNRLQQVDHERHELESLLEATEASYSDRSIALEDAREALEVTLAEAREKLERLERGNDADSGRLRQEIHDLRAERDHLANELLEALSSQTEKEETTEELIEKLEQSANERTEAADALSSLSRRLEEVQDGAESAAEQLVAHNARIAELEELLNGMRQELAAREQKLTQAEATIEALEGNVGKSSEFETFLTESEERLTDTEAKLVDAEARIDGLTDELEDREFELNKANARIESQKKSIDSVSVQLAEAETLADEHDARIAALERENDRLRRDLSDAQSKMLDAKGDVEEAHQKAQSATLELDKIKETLNDERGKTSSINSESVKLQSELAAKTTEVETLANELSETRERLVRIENAARENARTIRDRETALEQVRAELKQVREEAEGVRGELSTARDDSGANKREADELQRKTDELENELKVRTAELEAARNSASTSGDQRTELRADMAKLEHELAELREERAAEIELQQDRTKRIKERLELAQLRIKNAEKEREALVATLEETEQARQRERDELERVVNSERSHTSENSEELKSTIAELEALREKLNESETFILKHQREFEKVQSRHKSLLDEVRAIADLRTKYEKATGRKQQEFASQIGRRMDSLFSAAGKPVHADRKTEKVVILTIKKSDKEIAAEAEKPFVATNSDEDESSDTDENAEDSGSND